MLLVLSLTLFLFASAHCDNGPTDKETDAAFREAEKVLKRHKDVKAMLPDAKSTAQLKPAYKKYIYKIVKSLPEVVPKLESDNGFEVSQGTLILASSVAEEIPLDKDFSKGRALIRKVIGIIDRDKTGKIIDSITKVLQGPRDGIPQKEVDRFKDLLNSFMSAVRSRRYEEITQWANNRFNFGLEDVLKSTIDEYRISRNPETAQRAFEISILFAQVATLKDLAMTYAICVVEADRSLLNKWLAGAKNAIIAEGRNEISFWNNPKIENAAALVYYYPLGSSEKGKFLRSFLELLKVPEPEPWNPAEYVLMSVYWPTYHLYFQEASGNLFLTYSSNAPMGKDKITFHKQSDGYFKLSMKMQSKDIYAFVKNHPHYVYGNELNSGDEENYHFIVINYPDTDVITISCRKKPYKFFSGQKNKYSVILNDGYGGTSIQFHTNPCFRKYAGQGSYKCPEYNPKIR